MLAIETKDYYSIVSELYKNDLDLLNVDEKHYDNIEECIYGTIKDLIRACNLSYYAVYNNNVLVGHFGFENIDKKHLCTIYIKKELRNKEFNKQFFNLIKSKIGNNFYAGMRGNNPRALKYYQKMGGNIIQEFELNNIKNYILEFKGE